MKLQVCNRDLLYKKRWTYYNDVNGLEIKGVDRMEDKRDEIIRTQLDVIETLIQNNMRRERGA